jgi:hypothetical protein
MRRVYLETSVVSYLAARPSRDVVVAAHQELTRDWWGQRDGFDLFVSDPVLEEASRGDREAAQRRREFLNGIPVLTVHPDALGLARSFLSEAALPSKAGIDDLHVALAAVHGMDFLLTWNCTHIANARIRPQLEVLCWRAGRRPPVICTPFELLDEDAP